MRAIYHWLSYERQVQFTNPFCKVINMTSDQVPINDCFQKNIIKHHERLAPFGEKIVWYLDVVFKRCLNY